MRRRSLILTSDPIVRSQLSLLLKDLGTAPQVIADPETAASRIAAGDYSLAFVDQQLSADEGVSFIKRMSVQARDTMFLLISDEAEAGVTPPPFRFGADGVVYRPLDLPKLERRVAHMLDGDRPKPSGMSSAPFEAFRAERRSETASPFGTPSSTPPPKQSPVSQPKSRPNKASRQSTTTETHTPPASEPSAPEATVEGFSDETPRYHPRFLLDKSRASRLLISGIWKQRDFPCAVLIAGESGCEFELVARELLYASGDWLNAPRLLTEAEVTMENLSTINALAALDTGAPPIAYIPSVQTLPDEAVLTLGDFMSKVRHLDRRHLRLALGCEMDDTRGDSEQRSRIEDLLLRCDARLDILPLRERRAEIPYLAAKILADLVTLHPFLPVRELEPSAAELLQGYLWKGNFEQLVNVLRTAAAQCSNRKLGVDALSTILNSDLAHVHLMESFADEKLLQA